MAALIVDLAEAIVADLREQDFGVVIPWERSYGDVVLDLRQVGIRGDVVPVPQAPARLETRGSVQYDLTIEVVLRQKFNSQQDIDAGRIYREEIDKLVAVLESVQQRFVAGRPIANAVWAPARDQDVQWFYRREHLHTMNQFTGAVLIPYYATNDL